MEGPKKIYRRGQCWCEKPTHEDNKGYVPADIADALAEADEETPQTSGEEEALD